MGNGGSYLVGNANCPSGSTTCTGVSGYNYAAGTGANSWVFTPTAASTLDPTQTASFTCATYSQNNDYVSCTYDKTGNSGKVSGGAPTLGTGSTAYNTATNPVYCTASSGNGPYNCITTQPSKKADYFLWIGLGIAILIAIIVIIVIVMAAGKKESKKSKKAKEDEE